MLVAAEERLRASPFVIVAGRQRRGRGVAAADRGKHPPWSRCTPGDLAGGLQGCQRRACPARRGCARPLSRRGAADRSPWRLRDRDLRSACPVGTARAARWQTPYDAVLAFEIGAISVATGVPGSGKSTFTTFIADLVSRHEDIRVGLMSFETHPYRTRDHLSRLDTGLGVGGPLGRRAESSGRPARRTVPDRASDLRGRRTQPRLGSSPWYTRWQSAMAAN